MVQKVYIAGFLKYLSLTGIFFMVAAAHPGVPGLRRLERAEHPPHQARAEVRRKRQVGFHLRLRGTRS